MVYCPRGPVGAFNRFRRPRQLSWSWRGHFLLCFKILAGLAQRPSLLALQEAIPGTGRDPCPDIPPVLPEILLIPHTVDAGFHIRIYADAPGTLANAVVFNFCHHNGPP